MLAETVGLSSVKTMKQRHGGGGAWGCALAQLQGVDTTGVDGREMNSSCSVATKPP